MLEELARMAFHTFVLCQGEVYPLESQLLRKHFERKWGKDAYYGQK